MGPTVGLPRLSEHPGERRDLLPRLVSTLERLGAGDVVLEEGYGSAIGIDPSEYVAGSTRVRFSSADDCFEQDVVVALRCPAKDRLERLRPGAVLVSMLHYATRPSRTAWLLDRGIRAVSLDSVTDDRGRRLVENLELTAWAGVSASIEALSLAWPSFASNGRGPLHVTVLGAGALGVQAVHAAARYGNHELRAGLHRAGIPGVEVAVVDHDLSWNEDYMLERLRTTDVLVDATFRPDPTIPVVPNGWVVALPPHAILLDLAADPYDLAVEPPAIKGLEGVPHGTLSQYLFDPLDPAWETLAPSVDTANRRTALSCDAWPGLRPRESMERYGEQLEEILEVILTSTPDAWDRDSAHHRERAVARGELQRWTAHHR
jgi:alanine dehydrogenase